MLTGGGESELELIRTYTLTESWETDAKGNPVAIMQTVFTPSERMDFDYNDYLIMKVENNTNTSNYKANWMIIAARDNYGAVCRGSNVYRSIGTSTSFYISNGATLKFYKGNINDIQ